MLKKIDVFKDKIKVGALAITNERIAKEIIKKLSNNNKKSPPDGSDFYLSKFNYFLGFLILA